VPNDMRILSDLEIIQHNCAKAYAKQGAYIKKVKIGDVWVDKCFSRRCPRCEKPLPKGLKAGGIEACPQPFCRYQRRVFTPEEWQTLFNC
ncbi:hypothetical protein QUB27_27610, partial [Microcoleus sp. AT8-B6]|uniref:hypothetical protein n=1 Tax=Microcoleus sp. AT8-B6 TaxID=2818622 RepID=UPI002FCFFF69